MAKYLKFFTPTCHSCKQMTAVIRAKYPATELEEIDASDPNNEALVRQYGVSGVPTLINAATQEAYVGFNINSLLRFLAEGERNGEAKLPDV